MSKKASKRSCQTFAYRRPEPRRRPVGSPVGAKSQKGLGLEHEHALVRASALLAEGEQPNTSKRFYFKKDLESNEEFNLVTFVNNITLKTFVHRCQSPP